MGCGNSTENGDDTADKKKKGAKYERHDDKQHKVTGVVVTAPADDDDDDELATFGGFKDSSMALVGKSMDAPSRGVSPSRSRGVSPARRNLSRHGSFTGDVDAPVGFTLMEPDTGHQPSARKMHTMAPLGHLQVIMFGGVSRTEKFDQTADMEASVNKAKLGINHQTFRVTLEPTEWHQIKLHGDAPSHRAAHRAAVIEGSMYVYGEQKKVDNDIYAFNAAFSQWRKLKPVTPADQRPRPSSGASLVLASKTLVVFGGETDFGVSNDLHLFNTERKTWKTFPPKGPLLDGATGFAAINDKLVPRRDHSAVIHDQKMIVFGGFAVKSENAGLIAWDGLTGEWSHMPETGDVPKKRGGHVCCLYDRYMIVFGGMRHGRYLNDLCVYNVSTHMWTSVAQTVSPGHFVPSPRAFAAACRIDHTLYVHGGGDEHHIFAELFRLDLGPMAKHSDKFIESAPADPEANHHNPIWDDI